MEDTDAIVKESLLAKEDSFNEIYQNLLLKIEDVNFTIDELSVNIRFNSKNPDPIELALENKEDFYRVSYWDGYAVNEYYDYKKLSKAIKKLNKFSIKASENVTKFGLK